MNRINKDISSALSLIWTSTEFASVDLSRYAIPMITAESRKGVAALSMASLMFLLLASVLSHVFKLGSSYVYTYVALAALSLHICLSAWRMAEVKVLYMLAMALLVISGSSLVLIAQQTGKIDTMIFSSVAVLLMLVPIVPWGLREASFTVGAIYLMFTASTLLARGRFTVQELWTLQLLMLFTALVSILLVARALAVRKNDLQARFELQLAHNEMRDLSNRDHLTGAWNRRYLEEQYAAMLAARRAGSGDTYFALFDVDHFKQINDTFGHDRGDVLLKAIVQAFVPVLEEDEYLVRLGGDEFAVVMSGHRLDERIRTAFSAVHDIYRHATGEAGVRPTFSMGVVEICRHSMPGFEAVYKLADESLYEAKRTGRDRIVRHQPDPLVHAPRHHLEGSLS